MRILLNTTKLRIKAWEEAFKGYLHYMKKMVEGHRTTKLITTLIREPNLFNMVEPNNEPFSPLKKRYSNSIL
jgi:hypothetical protein